MSFNSEWVTDIDVAIERWSKYLISLHGVGDYFGAEDVGFNVIPMMLQNPDAMEKAYKILEEAVKAKENKWN